MIRRPRTLRAEERRLWAEVARAVTPLAGRLRPELEQPTPPAPSPVRTPLPPPGAAAKAGPPPLAPLERKVRTALRRGTLAVDAVLDLHGMRQAEAHGALLGFLHRARARDHGLVLVVTGKGAAGGGDGLVGERGVLRRVVPHWLKLPDLRPLVLSVEEAAAPHGGAGALYVRLRKRRSASPPV